MSRVYFPNLNGLRFVAAYAVILHHVEQFKSLFGYPNHWQNPCIRNVGRLGVVLFFVLSGFLITYLLLREKAQAGTIAIGNFYTRRILRIWPLYYFVLALALLVLPAIPSFALPNHWEQGHRAVFRGVLFVLFMPNLAYAAFNPLPYASQGWSVGVEEQFYLIWPIAIKLLRNTLAMLVGVVCAHAIIQLLLDYAPGIDRIRWVASACWADFNIDCMAIGGLAAWVLHRGQNRALGLLFSRYTQIFAYTVLLILVVLGVQFRFFHCQVYALLFAVMIVNCAANKRSVLNLEYKPLVYLGRISYGIYMYHAIAIVLTLKGLAAFGWTNSPTVNLISTGLTILLAAASYRYLEKPFLRLKLRYSTVVSGDNARVADSKARDAVILATNCSKAVSVDRS